MSPHNGLHDRSSLDGTLFIRSNAAEHHCFDHMDDPCCHCSLGQPNPECKDPIGCLIVTTDGNGNPIPPASSSTASLSGTSSQSLPTVSPPFMGDHMAHMQTPVHATSNTKMPAIIGGVVGGIVILILFALGIFLLMRRRKRQQPHKAPSAEFLDDGGGLLRRMHTAGSLTLQSPSVSMYGMPVTETPLNTNTALSDLPPAFTRGNFRDPVVEKVTMAHQTVAAYHMRDENIASLAREPRQIR